MQTHRSSCLEGPTSRFRGGWQAGGELSPCTQEFEFRNENALEDDSNFRADLVARVRREIANGTYDTEEKFEIALDRLMRHLDEMA